jgi:hypothetical protein
MSCKKIIFLIFVISCLSFSLLSRVEVVGARNEEIKLSDGIKVIGEITIKESPITLADIITGSLPAFLFCDDSEFGTALGTSRQLYVFDNDSQAISKVLTLKNVNQIVRRFEGTEDLLIIHRNKDKRLISRYNVPSGKLLWSNDFDFVSNYVTVKVYSVGYGINKSLKTVRTFYPSPPKYFFDHEKNQLIIAGLVIGDFLSVSFLSEKDPIGWGNRILVMDVATGEVLQNTHFDLQRNVDNNLKLFVSLERKEFQIVDMNNIKSIIAGKFKEGDLLVKKGFAAPIDMRGRRFGGYRSYLYSIMTEKELIITSQYSGKKLFSINKANVAWVKFDLNGNRLGPITPAPEFFVGNQVRNQGKNKWPLIFKGRNSMFILMDKEGNLTNAPMPEIKGYPKWFHDDNNIYGWAKRVLYRAAIGENTTVPVYKAPAGRKVKIKYDSVPDGNRDIVMLSGPKGALLVRLTDGQPLTMEYALHSAPAGLFWSVADVNRLLGQLPESGLPARFKAYLDVDIDAHEIGCIEKYKKDEIEVLRVWGNDPQKEYGDIALVPARLKDGSAVLIGIRLPQNDVLFWVPMMRIKGLSKKKFREGQVFIFDIKYVDQKNAFLILAEKLNSYKIYSISRPAMQAVN